MGKSAEADIFEALKKVATWKRQYFVYKFPEFKLKHPDMNTNLDDILRATHKKSTLGFRRWEKSEEYAHLVALALDARATNDLIEMYEAVRKNAIKGDEKAVKLMLQLQQEITERKKIAIKAFSKQEIKEKEGDDLI